MKLVDFTVEVRFKGKLNMVRNDLRLALSKKIAPPNAQPKQPDTIQGIEMRLKEKRAHVAAQENRYAVTLQNKNLTNALKTMTSYIATINEVIDYSDLDIARLGIRTTWINKCQGDMSALKALYKTKFFADNKLLDSAVDYGVQLTLETDEFTVNYMTGPVTKKEQLPLVTFPVGDLNPANVLVGIDCFKLDIGKQDTKEITTCIRNALTYGEHTAQDTLEVLGA